TILIIYARTDNDDVSFWIRYIPALNLIIYAFISVGCVYSRLYFDLIQFYFDWIRYFRLYFDLIQFHFDWIRYFRLYFDLIRFYFDWIRLFPVIFRFDPILFQ